MLKNLDRRGKKGNGTVRSAEVKGFARLRDGDNKGGFPNSGQVSMVKGKVKEFG